jgi:hypothetical protein
MSAHTTSILANGDRCIIYVDIVNSPSGWWWGQVTSTDPLSAVITGEFLFTPYPQGYQVRAPVYGESRAAPVSNYTVYVANQDNVGLISALADMKKAHKEAMAKATTQIETLHDVIRGLKVASDDPRVSNIVKAVYAELASKGKS